MSSTSLAVYKGALDTELTIYAYAEAKNMGLRKPLTVRIAPSLNVDGTCTSKDYGYEITLKRPIKIVLRHELGHAYTKEKHPRLYKFLGSWSDFHIRPRLGIKGTATFITLTQMTLGVGLGMSLANYATNISIPMTILGVVMESSIALETVIASYFGEVYKPKRNI